MKTSMTLLAEILTVPYNPVWDFVRLLQLVAAGIVGCWLLRVAVFRTSAPQDPFTKWCFVGMAGALVLATLQAVDAMGQPFPLWRAPLFLFVMFTFWRAVHSRL